SSRSDQNAGFPGRKQQSIGRHPRPFLSSRRCAARTSRRSAGVQVCRVNRSSAQLVRVTSREARMKRLMMVGRSARIGVTLVALLLLGRGLASAQTSSIVGTVKDTTGAVLPGVTVEASSPVLIEKARTVITDAEVAYKIVTLVPGS